MTASRAVAAVARYSLLELVRRRFLVVFVVLGVVTAGFLEWLPSVVMDQPVTGADRSALILMILGGVGPPARSPLMVLSPATVIGLFAYAIGMVIVNHDLDSGVVVSIFAKPIPRAGYALGKALAAGALLFASALLIGVCTDGLMAANGNNYSGVVVTYFLAAAANLLVLTLLIMILTVYLNNVVAAVIAFIVAQIVGIVAPLHAAVTGGDITNAFWAGAINVAYDVQPFRLNSALGHEAVTQALRLGLSRPEGDPFAQVATTSGILDLAIWAAYVLGLFGLLVLALYRKQV